MKNLLKTYYFLIALIMLTMGIACLLRPGTAFFWSQKITYMYDFRWVGVASLVLGVVTILGSYVSRWQNFLAVVGLFMVLKGLFFLVAPMKGLNDILSLWFSAAQPHYRYLGAGLVILSGFIFKAVWTRHRFLK